ncbi:hypothetical protein [Candidatus Enterovibrio escicola]|nr:hypothetical protein [Candidatus Enterovibrio escacola]
MTVVIAVPQSGYRDFKTYYYPLCLPLAHQRISQLHANIQAHARCSGSVLLLPHSPSGIAFVDSSKIQVYNTLCIFIY